MSSKACPECGRIAALDAQYCQQCGHQYRTKFAPAEDRTQMNLGRSDEALIPRQEHMNGDGIQMEPGSHSRLLAFLLSLVVPFVGGMVYNRQYAKAVIHGLMVGACVITCTLLPLLWLLGAPFLFVLWLTTIIDSVLVANRLREGEAVDQWQSF